MWSSIREIGCSRHCVGEAGRRNNRLLSQIDTQFKQGQAGADSGANASWRIYPYRARREALHFVTLGDARPRNLLSHMKFCTWHARCLTVAYNLAGFSGEVNEQFA